MIMLSGCMTFQRKPVVVIDYSAFKHVQEPSKDIKTALVEYHKLYCLIQELLEADSPPTYCK